jgi:ribonuclease Z
MTTEIIPLGTASAIPTRTRHLSGCALRREGHALLFDCGEGTQYQLLKGGLNRSRLDAVFITHVHGDHLYGLPGLLATLALMNREAPLTLVGPAGLEAILAALPGLERERRSFELRFVELEEGFGHRVVFETDDFTVEARELAHRIFAAGFRFEEKARPGRVDAAKARAAGLTEGGQFEALKRREAVTLADGRVVEPEGLVGPERPGASFAYVLDTRPSDGGRALARGADLVLHEATFAHALLARAVETGHSTAREAAEVARDAGAKKLLLTHFSSRYAEPDALVEEARRLFPNTDAAEELRRYVLGADGVTRG